MPFTPRNAAASAFLLVALVACSGSETTIETGPSPARSTILTSPPPTPSRTSSRAPDAPPVVVVMLNYRFEPASFTVTGARRIMLRNEGPLLHNFSLPQAGINADVEPGAVVTTPTVALAPGTYAFACRYHDGTYGMRGSLQAG